MGCIFWSGFNCKEYGDITQGSWGITKPSNTGEALATTHAGHTGMYVVVLIPVTSPFGITTYYSFLGKICDVRRNYSCRFAGFEFA